MERHRLARSALRQGPLQVQRHRDLTQETPRAHPTCAAPPAGVNGDLKPGAAAMGGEERRLARDPGEVVLGEVEPGGDGGIRGGGGGGFVVGDEGDGDSLVGKLVEADLGEARGGGRVDAGPGGRRCHSYLQRQVTDDDPNERARIHLTLIQPDLDPPLGNVVVFGSGKTRLKRREGEEGWR